MSDHRFVDTPNKDYYLQCARCGLQFSQDAGLLKSRCTAAAAPVELVETLAAALDGGSTHHFEHKGGCASGPGRDCDCGADRADSAQDDALATYRKWKDGRLAK